MNEKEMCQICHHRIAEHKFVRVVDGITKSYRICSHCKALMDNKYAELRREAARRAVPVEERVCPVCGTTFRDFTETGLLGCDNCYKVFDDYLIEYIRGYHGATTHCGMDDSVPQPVDIEELYQQLKHAVDAKDYDRAAKLQRLIDERWGKIDE